MGVRERFSFEIIEGKIQNGETLVQEVRITIPDNGEHTFTFDEEVPEDEVGDEVAIEALKELGDNIDFNYTETRRFRGDNETSQALVDAFYINPFTTGQFTEINDSDYASSFPSKLRDRGLITSIGEISEREIWTLTPEGIKEALCLIGHPETIEELADIRQHDDNAGLHQLFDNVEEDEEAEADE